MNRSIGGGEKEKGKTFGRWTRQACAVASRGRLNSPSASLVARSPCMLSSLLTRAEIASGRTWMAPNSLCASSLLSVGGERRR